MEFFRRSFLARPSFLSEKREKRENLIMNTLEHSLNYFPNTMQEARKGKFIALQFDSQDLKNAPEERIPQRSGSAVALIF